MNQESVLIVDSDEQIQRMILDVFESFGHACLAVKDGIEAISRIKYEDYDIIVCDTRSPGMGGIEILAHVRQMLGENATIIITGESEDYSFDQIIGAGAADFIKKPVDKRELKAKLERVLKERELAQANLRLHAEQAILNDKLRSLLDVARDLTAEHDFSRLFNMIVGKVTGLMEAERSSLYIIDWARQEIWTRVAENVEQIRMPIGSGISGHVAQTGQIVNAADAWQLPFFNRSFDKKHHFRTRSVLCIPVRNRAGDRIAVLQVINKLTGEAFDTSDLYVLEGLASQIGIALENSTLYEELKLGFEGFVRTLSATVDAKHPLTAGHSQRVTEFSTMIAREIGLDENTVEVIKYAALLHDIGKIGISDRVLLKDGAFTEEDRAEMNTHPLKTLSILKNFRFPSALADVPAVAAQHHEKVNGKGYPYGLKGLEISLGAKIIAVADVFDALTSPRDYPKYTKVELLGREPMPLSKVLAILEEEAGEQFDDKVVAAFMRLLPQALLLYRGTHFRPEYVDSTIEQFNGQQRGRAARRP